MFFIVFRLPYLPIITQKKKLTSNNCFLLLAFASRRSTNFLFLFWHLPFCFSVTLALLFFRSNTTKDIKTNALKSSDLDFTT
jgi:hypothetical protein